MVSGQRRCAMASWHSSIYWNSKDFEQELRLFSFSAGQNLSFATHVAVNNVVLLGLIIVPNGPICKSANNLIILGAGPSIKYVTLEGEGSEKV